jgi:hypothetical protein
MLGQPNQPLVSVAGRRQMANVDSVAGAVKNFCCETLDEPQHKGDVQADGPRHHIYPELEVNGIRRVVAYCTCYHRIEVAVPSESKAVKIQVSQPCAGSRPSPSR